MELWASYNEEKSLVVKFFKVSKNSSKSFLIETSYPYYVNENLSIWDFT